MSDLISKQATSNTLVSDTVKIPVMDGTTERMKAVDTWIPALDKLRRKLYQKCMVEDSEGVKWDSGCWVRYWLIEQTIEEVAIEIATGEEDT